MISHKQDQKSTKMCLEGCNAREENCAYHAPKCKRRTYILKYCESLIPDYRKNKNKISVMCQILLVFQLIVCTIATNGIRSVDGYQGYSRLSISNGDLVRTGFLDIDSGVSHVAGGVEIGSINDFRHVSHEELLSFGNGFDNFTDPGVTHFSEILFDFIHHQVCLLCMPYVKVFCLLQQIPIARGLE